ncbi:MAG: arsenate reductase ArsC [Desulfarculus sp.]|nr:arsenate reductase ArsC [Pseudomonadota bacterium]MBV1717944.1 arsenate reductase ArsC [Desulfarculus sp.]MBU4576602.1 arsenate reductase ArsC [Pseudomonadota bacterium]MBU4598069.1 arsenate reductase ArsC [Pseudomonadota bacterium]MBV1739442.1 arsenate reductase ArsC [Desulfarculus sp.]
MSDTPKKRILFLCTGNSCRSQMAEGFTNALRGDEYEAFSAGVAPGRVDPRAVAAMAEAGVDISGQKSKAVDPFIGQDWDWVVTLCDNANEACPFFPGPVTRVHRGFDDPPLLATGAADEEEALAPYRRVRDEIKAMVLGLPRSLQD